MQVTELLSDGLKREFQVIVPIEELDGKLVEKLDEIQGQVRIRGFRPGKVPANHLRKLYGRSAMSEIVQNTLREVARQTLEERGERAAASPEFDLPEDEAEADKILSGKADLTYKMSYEVLPKITLGDFKGIKVERPVVEVSDEEVNQQLEQLAESGRSYDPKEGIAEKGDQVVISFVGKIAGAPFEGGSSDNATLRLGSGQFIPGFEEGIEGTQVGEEKTISVTFPEDYQGSHVAGKEATFDITVKQISAPGELVTDDRLAERLGLESVEKLKEAIRQQLANQYGEASRMKVKRQVLDQLDELHSFSLPGKMVETEFENIWRQITSDMAQSARDFESEGTTEEAARADYRKISERRVRLGLVLSEIGERNGIQVTEEEVQRALAAQLRQFPGNEQTVLNYYRNDPDALAGLRAPIFEEKVVDFLLELAEVTDKPVTREELLKDDGAGDAI